MIVNPTGQLVMRMDVVAKHTPSEEFYIDYYRTSHVTTCSVLDAATMCSRLQREAGVPYVVHRTYSWEPAPASNTDANHIKEHAKTVYQSARNLRSQVGNHSVHIMVNCEQGGSPARFKMYAEMIKEAMLDPEGPVGMVFGNVAVGNMKSGFHGEPNDWLHPWIQEFLLTMDQYRKVRLPSGSYAFLLGVHNYIALYPWISVNGGQHRFDAKINPLHNWTEGDKFLNGDAHINWNLPQDHLGREYQGIRFALGWKWNDDLRKWVADRDTKRRGDGTPVEPPWYVVTEQLIDAVNDVKWVHRSDMSFEDPYKEPAGYHSLAKTWERPDWFPEKSAGGTLAEFTRWTWIVIHGPTGYCVGMHDFCSGDTGGWDSHNVAPGGTPDVDYYTDLGAFRAEMPDHFFRDVPTQPTPVPNPTPPSKPFLAVMNMKLDYVNIRQQPTTNSPIVGRMPRKSFVIWTDKVSVDSFGKTWRYVILHPALKGWVRTDLFTEQKFSEEILKEYL